MTDQKIDHTIIIAEAGVNHNGDFDCARRMIAEAAKAGADYVKFQTFRAENLVCARAKRAEYQARNCGGEESQLQMLKRLELDFDDFATLKNECRRHNIGFLSSAFDLESIQLLASLGMDFWKIPSGEITNLPYLEAIADNGGRIILSTGMSTPDEIQAAIDVFTSRGIARSNIALLHCNTQYPTPAEDVNLRAMLSLDQFHCGKIGFSDHTQGIATPIAAVAMGARIIEKHFTLDRTLPGPDHKASADVEEFTAMVAGIRFVERALGSSLKHVTQSESDNKGIARKSIVAKVPIAKGELLTTDNLTTKRPGTGLSPMLWHKVLGTPAIKSFNTDELITL